MKEESPYGTDNRCLQWGSVNDTTLVQENVLGVGAGLWGHEIMITPDHLVQAAQAVVVNLTDKSKPIFNTP